MSILRFPLFLCLVVLGADASAQSTNSETAGKYVDLAKKLPSHPRFLLDEMGKSAEFESGTQGQLRLKNGEIIDADGTIITLPNNIIIKPFPDTAGAYLIERQTNGRSVFGLARFIAGNLVLGQAFDHPLVPGALLALNSGVVGLYAVSSNGVTYVDPIVAKIVNGRLEMASTNSPTMLSQEWHKLGFAVHPTTGEQGIALFQPVAEPKLLLVFENSDPIEIAAERGVELFGADGGKLLAGYYQKDCISAPGTPAGLCTPFVYELSFREVGPKISLADFDSARLIARPVPGWTFGANHRIYEPSDFAIAGNRMYVISYRGMTQSLIYYQLDEPESYHVVLQPRQGSNLEIQQINGDPGAPNLVVKRSSLFEDTEIFSVGFDGLPKTLAKTPNLPEGTAIRLSVATFDKNVSQGIPPFVILGNASTIQQNYCRSGLALVEIYGGLRRPLRARNPLGLLPDLFSKDGVLVLASIPGSGGFGIPWSTLGAFENSLNQVRSARDIVQLLRNTGCNRITVTGFSHGGVVALNSLILYPDVVNNIIIGGTPLDLRKEFEAGNRTIAPFLPRGLDSFSSGVEDGVFASVSPKELALAARDLSGTSITIFAGENDNLAKTYFDAETIDILRSKGADVLVIERPGIGHAKYVSETDWVEYHSIVGTAVRSSR